MKIVLSVIVVVMRMKQNESGARKILMRVNLRSSETNREKIENTNIAMMMTIKRALLLVCVHVAGVLLSSMINGENLIRSMIMGYKKSGIMMRGLVDQIF